MGCDWYDWERRLLQSWPSVVYVLLVVAPETLLAASETSDKGLSWAQVSTGGTLASAPLLERALAFLKKKASSRKMNEAFSLSKYFDFGKISRLGYLPSTAPQSLRNILILVVHFCVLKTKRPVLLDRSILAFVLC